MSVASINCRLDANLTSQQDDCLNYKGKNLLIKGVAGSGKTLVLLRKAIRLKQEAIKNNSNISIGFFTYANTLTKYSKDLVEEIESGDMITISTFHSYASKLVSNLYRRNYRVIDSKLTKSIIETCIKNDKLLNREHRLHKLDIDFWKDEFSWMKGKKVSSKEEYIIGNRTGRGSGIRLNKKDKEVVYRLFEAFNKYLTKKSYIQYDDMSNIVLDRLDKLNDTYKFDYILVDEAQDLSYSQLLLLRNLAKESIIIAADHAQKIYKNSFTWKELGINVQGNSSKTLSKNFRSTRQIMELSYSLLEKNKSHKGTDTEYTKAQLPDIEGEKPVILSCKDQKSEDKVLLELLNQLNDGEITIGIAYRRSKQKYGIVKLLKSEGIGFEYVEGKDYWNLTKPGIKLVTIHSAKGLEFDVVIIPKLNQGVIPVESDDETDKDNFLENERSLLYVAMTRAKEELYMITSGEKSQFISEMDENLYELEEI
jgi:superfamily I DNA/RNA helicase